jgi:NAD dependent epimerase/dehydratase
MTFGSTTARATALAGRTVLVTGAGGFIGSHLVERLVEEGARVRALVHYNSRNDWGMLDLVPDAVTQEIEVLCGDIRDPFCVRKAVSGCKVIFHLASLIPIPYSYVAPQSFVATNVLGTVNVMQACREESVDRIVQTSTSEVYGNAQYVPIDEAHPLHAQSPYAASKIGADMVAESYWRSFGLPIAIIRPFNTYGPRQSARAVIPTIVSQALAGGVVRLGATLPTRDLNYVDDTVDGFVRMGIADEAVGQVINVGSGREISIADLARTILRLLNSSACVNLDEQRVRPALSEVGRLVCNSDRARAILSWESSIPLEVGLERTIEWIRQNAARYKPQIYNL